MTREEREIEAARFLRWHEQRGGQWVANYAEWVRTRGLEKLDAYHTCYVVMGALLDGDGESWTRTLIPTADDILQQFNDEEEAGP